MLYFIYILVTERLDLRSFFRVFGSADPGVDPGVEEGVDQTKPKQTKPNQRFGLLLILILIDF